MQCEGELHTEIVIDRVVRGNLKPGRHKLLITGPVGWEDDGLVIATTSSWVPGDVDDVSAEVDDPDTTPRRKGFFRKTLGLFGLFRSRS